MANRWIRFDLEPRDANRLTERWRVMTTSEPSIELGVVRWYSPWRCYAFHPEINTVFEQECLHEIAQFCYGVTVDHKRRLRV
jgi:hypothetical protein